MNLITWSPRKGACYRRAGYIGSHYCPELQSSGKMVAVDWLKNNSAIHTYNWGGAMKEFFCGRANTEFEVEQISYCIVQSRQGDVRNVLRIPYLHRERMLRSISLHGLAEKCKDAWNWRVKNPHGYDS